MFAFMIDSLGRAVFFVLLGVLPDEKNEVMNCDQKT